MNILKKSIILSTATLLSLAVSAQDKYIPGYSKDYTPSTSKALFKADRAKAGSNYLQYPGPQSRQTPAPEGYEPYYLSHYGRHGSRYHIGSVYAETYDILHKADSAGVLTERGKQLLNEVAILRDEAAGRDGELTELGAQQHHEIAARMYNNFPEIFTKPVVIDAKSTVVIRCILSMENALQELVARNPKLTVKHDASYHDMYYMNQSDKVISEKKRDGEKITNDYTNQNTHPERLMKVLFTNDTYWKKSLNAKKLFRNIYKLASNIQSSEIRHKMDLMPLFTDEEIYQLWENQNVFWYNAYGPSRYSGGVQAYSQRNLLTKIIQEADSCLVLDNPGATLRYGHDTMVMPLSVLLELDNLNQDIADLNTLDTHGWRDYEVFPMACNIQFVFYKGKSSKAGTADKDAAGNDILVKVLRNENEARLPIATNQWPYYKWSDVKAYYQKKIADYNATR